MFCISISHKSADVGIREKLAFSPEVQRRLITELCSSDNISQCVLLCTCSRTEVYFCGTNESRREVERTLGKYSGAEDSSLAPYIRFYGGDKAARHLFRVASGIDSMVIGEDEILGQTKNAYRTAAECETVSYELNMMFKAAVTCAKKIKTQTALSKTSVSIATLAANEASRLGSSVNVLVIGATGKIGSSTLKNLISHKNVNVTATLRRHNSEFAFCGSSNVKTADYDDRYSFMNEADCVISATSGPHYTVTLRDLQKVLVQKKDRLFIDLAVPPDIDGDIVRLDGIKLMGIDRFEQLAEENNALKMSSAEAAEQMIGEELDVLKKDIAFHDFLPYADSVKRAVSDNSFDTLLYRLKSELDSEQFSAVLSVLKNYGGQN